MKKFFSFLAIAMIACATVFAADNNKVIDKNLNVGSFEKISVKGSDMVVYTQGDKVSVRLHGTLEQIDAMIVNVEGNTLNVSRKSSFNNGTGFTSFLRALVNGETIPTTVVVYVTAPDLTSVKVTGSGDFKANGEVDTDNIEIVVTGSGDIDFKSLVCDNADISVTGSGDIEIDKLESVASSMSVRGSGDIHVKQQRVRKTDLNIYGSGDIVVQCNNCGEVNASVYGSGDITLSGQYQLKTKNVRGSGDINQR